MSLVTVSIVGNLVKPPDMTHFASGRVKTTMVVAVNTKGKTSSERADFYRVEVWGKLAELAGAYLDKGYQVGVSGRLCFDHWTDKQGKERVTPIVEAAQLAFPPRLRVVRSDDQAGGSTIEAPTGGSPVVADAEDGEPLQATELPPVGNFRTTRSGNPGRDRRVLANTGQS